MPGIGKYKKGKKFELRSGNNPPFRMMGSSPMHKDTKDKSVSEKQTEIDLANISEFTNQPIDNKQTEKSVKRQNRLNTRDMSRSDIQKELKRRKKEGLNVSEKLDVGFLGRVFGSKKDLASKLSHQKNVSDI